MLDVSQHSGAEVLAALYNHSTHQGYSFRDPRGQKTITVEDAQVLIDEAIEYDVMDGYRKGAYFDYVFGWSVKVEIGYDAIDERAYDMDNGQGAAIRAIDSIDKRLKTIRLDVD